MHVEEAPGVWREHSNAQCARLECSAMTGRCATERTNRRLQTWRTRTDCPHRRRNYRRSWCAARRIFPLRLCRQPYGRPVLLASHFVYAVASVPISRKRRDARRSRENRVRETTPSPAATRRGAQQNERMTKFTGFKSVSSTKVANWSTVIFEFSDGNRLCQDDPPRRPSWPLVHLPTQESPS